MAFGFPPKHIQDFQLDNLDKEHFLVLAIEAALRLGWNVRFVSESGLIAHTQFSWNSGNEEVMVKIGDDVANLRSECTGNQLIDWGKNKKNAEALLSKIEDLKGILSQEEVESRIEELRQVYVPQEHDILSKPHPTSKENINGFLSIFSPTEGYFITPILVNINILIFIVMLISGVHFFMPENQDLLNWGANFRPLTLEGQWWRLFTACFLHIGVLHLLLNMYALMCIGVLLESFMGKERFLAAYLISGIAASMVSLWWHDLVISAGASGAIFGMYGVFIALLTTNLLEKSIKNELLTSIGTVVGYNIVLGLRANSGIDNAAHIGGLISGLIIGYTFVPSLKQFENKIIKFSTMGVLVALLLVPSFIVYKALPNDIGKYEEKMKKFASTETMALEVYNLPENTPKEKILSILKDKGIYYWNENIKLVNSLKNLNLPLHIRTRNDRIKEYCELRIQTYKLIYKTVEEDTNKYEQEIKNFNQKIEAIIKELSDK